MLSKLNKFKSWAIVAFHYSALHLIDAYIDEKYSIHPKRHVDREKILAKDKYLKKIYLEYNQLKTDSEFTRYNSGKFSNKEITTIRTYFTKLKGEIAPQLKS